MEEEAGRAQADAMMPMTHSKEEAGRTHCFSKIIFYYIHVGYTKSWSQGLGCSLAPGR